MSYRIRYSAHIDWVGDGEGPMTGLAAGISPGGGAGSYTKAFFQSPVAGTVVVGTGSGGVLAAADVDTLTTAMATDINTQVDAALAELGQWATGGVV